ncbi:unnamed protein product, partial [Mesorhabditis belari]|uniref:Uncharacterized protein n=1 Tax=Mesorhabditis belari TaxID=2138241 RepID=A0AAF3JC36_9BILA
MPRFIDVKEENRLSVQVSADLARGTFNVPQITATRSYIKENVAGIKNLTTTFTASTDMNRFKTSHSASLTYRQDLGKNIDLQFGAKCDLEDGKVVIPLTLTDKSTGLSAGLEIKATINLRELQENGVNLFVKLPMFGGNVTLKYNPITQAVLVQFATSLDYPKGKPDDDPEATCCCLTVDYNQGVQVEQIVQVQKRKRSPIRQVRTNTNDNGGFWRWLGSLFEKNEENYVTN